MQRANIQLPDVPMIDTLTGYAINVPLGYQDYPGWQLDKPDIIERIYELRIANKVVVINDFFMDPLKGKATDALEDYVQGRNLQDMEAMIRARVENDIAASMRPRKKSDLETVLENVIAGLQELVEVKKVVRHVRTPAGVARYKQPIGSVIVADGNGPGFRLPNINFRQRYQRDDNGKLIKDSAGNNIPEDDGYDLYVGANNQNYWVYEDGGRWYAADDDNYILYDAKDEAELLESINLDAESEFASADRGRRQAPAGFHAATIEERQARKVPPAWVDVFINDDENAALIAVGYDGKDRKQSLYSAEHTRGQADVKYEHVKSLRKYMPTLDKALNDDWKSNSNAQALILIRQLGMRPGSTSETRAQQKAYGAITLEARHVTINKDSVTFDFTGKKGVRIHLNTKDPQVIAVVKEAMKGKSRSDRLFESVTPQSVAIYLKSKTADKVKLKDLRTYKANEIALAEVAKIKRKPKSESEFKRIRNAIGDTVAARLGNTRTMSLNSYINPSVFYAIATEPEWLDKIIKKQRKEDDE